MQDNTQEAYIEDEQEGGINIQRVIRSFLSNWYWFAICLVVFYLGATVYLRYAIPKYKVSAKILIKDQDESGSDGQIDENVLQGLGLMYGKTNLNNEMDIISSVVLMDEVVKQLQVNVRYYTIGKFMVFEQYTKLPFRVYFKSVNEDSFQNHNYAYRLRVLDKNSYEISVGKKKWSGRWNDTIVLPIGKAVATRNALPLADTSERYLITISPYKKVSNQYNKLVTASMPNKLATFITLDLNETFPDRGGEILNRLIKVYIQNNIDDRNLIADSTIAFINDRLSKVGDNLDSLEGNIAIFKRSNSLVNVEQQSALLVANTDASMKTLNDQEVKLDIVTEVEKYIKAHPTSPVPTSLMGLEPLFTDIVKQYNDGILNRDKLLEASTPAMPLVKNADETLNSLRINLLNSITSVKRELSMNIDATKKEKGLYISEVEKSPSLQQTYLEYSRQQLIKQELYLFLLKTREQTAITKSSSIGNTRIIEPPSCRTGPFSPNHTFTIYLSLALGLIIPAISIYLKGLFNNRIVSKDDVTNLSRLTIIGEIGHNGEKENLAVSSGNKSIISEQFRFLCTNLQFYLANPESKVILITSSMVNEGKSFISLNLASSLAIIGKKVVVMELDLHRPKISKNLGIENTVGFSTYTIGKAEFEEIVRPTGQGFDIISSGPIPPNPAELITLPKIKELFVKLREMYDYIVIDTPPIGLVADAQVASQYADATLYIIRQHFTYKDQLKIVNDLYRHKKMPKLTLVMNDNTSGLGGYSYNYGYGYGYGYGYTYGEHKKKPSFFKRIFTRNKSKES